MKITKDTDKPICGWAAAEFGGVDLGDQRLKTRLIAIVERLSESPESPINQACNSWSETKAAYRFFQNENVCEEEILASHVQQVVERSKANNIILAVQDTSYISYTSHKKTTGLGIISKAPGKNVKMMSSLGVIMHTSFAMTIEGLPLGLLDQKVFARESLPDEIRDLKKKSHNINVPIEDKESIRWLNSLKKTQEAVAETDTRVVTVCDREGDFYEFLECANKIGASFLVRARADRTINKSSRYSEKSDIRLWSYIQSLPNQGSYDVEIPARDDNPARTATLETRFGSFTMNPPRNHIRHKTEVLPDLHLNAIYVVEKNPPEGIEPLEWMLLTDLPVTTFEEAIEKVRWYCLRWRIEIFHKILKSGLRVEKCRLQTADRLIRYLTVMSIIAWRIYWITIIARTDPELPCTKFMAEEECKVLHAKLNSSQPYPKDPPRMREAVRGIAMLGGFLARKGDGEPGVMTLWRGWKRLCDLTEGWNLALAK